MSVWKQLLVTIGVLLVGLYLWTAFFPGAPAILEKTGLSKPLASLGIGAGSKAKPPADTSGGQGGGARTAQAPSGAGGSGGGRGRGGFSRTSIVVVKPAESAIINDRVSALGSGVALQTVTLLAQASGTLTDIPVHSGAQVKAGDVIARLDSETEQLAYDKARLAHDDAVKTLERNQALLHSNAVSASQMQSFELAAQVADLNMKTAAQALADRTVTAPISGQIGIVQVSIGNQVTPQTVIATIQDTSGLLVNYWLPDRLVGAVRVGDTASLVPVALPQLTLQGKVTAIDNKVDPASGTYQVQARVDNADGKLRSGMAFTVTMRFPGDTFIAVDPLAIQWGTDGAYVWRMKDGKVEKVAVRIVQRNTESVLVAGKLAVGDQIVTEGLEGLRPGAEVQVQGPAPSPQDTGSNGPAKPEASAGAGAALAGEAPAPASGKQSRRGGGQGASAPAAN